MSRKASRNARREIFARTQLAIFLASKLEFERGDDDDDDDDDDDGDDDGDDDDEDDDDDDDDVGPGLNVLGCRADMLGTNYNRLLKLKVNWRWGWVGVYGVQSLPLQYV